MRRRCENGLHPRLVGATSAHCRFSTLSVSLLAIVPENERKLPHPRWCLMRHGCSFITPTSNDDTGIILLCEAGTRPPVISTKSDPQPSILSQDAPFMPLGHDDQSGSFRSGWGILLLTLALLVARASGPTSALTGTCSIARCLG